MTFCTLAARCGQMAVARRQSGLEVPVRVRVRAPIHNS